MVDTNRPISSVKYDTITNQHAYTLTMVIKKQYGAIPVNVVSVIFNLEYTNKKNWKFPLFPYFPLCRFISWFIGVMDFYFMIYWCYGPTNMASFIPLIIPNNTINLFCRPNHMHLQALFGVDTTYFFFDYVDDSTNYFYFEIIVFAIDGFCYLKVVSYQFGYTVQ